MAFRAAELEGTIVDAIAENCGTECVNCDPTEPSSPCYARYVTVMDLLVDAEGTLYFRPGAE